EGGGPSCQRPLPEQRALRRSRAGQRGKPRLEVRGAAGGAEERLPRRERRCIPAKCPKEHEAAFGHQRKDTRGCHEDTASLGGQNQGVVRTRVFSLRIT